MSRTAVHDSFEANDLVNWLSYIAISKSVAKMKLGISITTNQFHYLFRDFVGFQFKCSVLRVEEGGREELENKLKILDQLDIMRLCLKCKSL